MASYQPPASSYAPTSHRASYVPRPSSGLASGAAPGGGGGGGLPQYVPPTQATNVPPGTLPPGTIVRVGEYEVTVDRFLSEGGFAHVYLATSAMPIPAGSPNATTKHVLKRMAVPDTKGVQEVGKEVEVMKLVRNHPKIVNIIEASVAELPGGMNGSKGYEIYILMEWCAGGGIIDMMNTRLQNRLTETEILKIFSDTVEAVAHMHYQNPPLIHRDLKVENILLSPPQTFKLCDFGSTTKPLPREKVPTAVEQLQALELEINKTTTLQYRAPELVDIWGRKGFDEKIDIWALGVFLYKLCYYTTPFEEHGPLAILSAQYKIPHYPAYSNSIKGLIAGMLQESAAARPNIYQVHEQVCRLRGTAVRLENKYDKSSATRSSKSTSDHFSGVLSSGPVAPSSTGPSLAETISPMRRGRPAKGGLVATTAKNVDEQGAPRLVKTGSTSLGHEWEPMGASSKGGSAWPTGSSAPSTGSNGFGDSFTSVGSNGAKAGFGDSFRPSSPEVAKPTSSATASPSLPPISSSSAAFSDLVPASSKSPAPSASSALAANKSPLLASTNAVLNDQTWRTRPLSSASARTSPAPIAPSLPPELTAPATEDERKRFESTYPDLDGLESFASAKSPVSQTSSTKATLSPTNGVNSSTSPLVSTLAPLTSPPSTNTQQLTGEGASTAPALGFPRRPPTTTPSTSSTTAFKAPAPLRVSTRPDLISRSSQTSPHLLGGGNKPFPGQQSMLNKPTAAANDLGRDPVALPGMAKASGARPFSSASSSKPVTSRWNSTTQTSTASAPSLKPAPIDLLGDDEENDDAFAPKPLNGGPTSSEPAQMIADTATTTLPPLVDAPPSVAPVSPNRASTIATSDFNFEAARAKFRPVKPSDSPVASKAGPSSRLTVAGKPAPTSDPAPTPIATKYDADDLEGRFPAIESLDAPRQEATSALMVKKDSWQPIVEKEDDSSGDEAEIEDFAPRARLQGPRMPREDEPAPAAVDDGKESQPVSTADQVISPTSGKPVLPPITRLDSSSTDGGGEIDLGPALASIRKFAPVPPPKPDAAKSEFDESDDRKSATTTRARRASSPPPIIAPKPQSVKRQDQITNLVSRYEGLSTSGGPSELDTRKALPPAPGAKPTTLRQTSAGKPRPSFGSKRASVAPSTTTEEPPAQAAPHWSSRQVSIGDFSSQFPDTDGLDAHLTGESRVPRPTTPPRSVVSPSTTSTPSSPAVFNSGNRPPPFKPVPPTSGPSTPQRSFALPSKPQEQEEEEEERFAGVSNMKNRWESITREQAAKEGAPRGPGKVEKRKSWAVV